jgi:acetyl esterase/lipase
MPSEELELIDELLRSQAFSQMTMEEQRAVVESGAGQIPEGTSIVAVDADGVPCEWITVPGAGDGTTVVALRGGGYCLGSLRSNRHFCALLSARTSARVLNVGYRNAPEHRFPAALDDTTGAYQWLLGQGVDPPETAFAGNSAGGGLVLATLLARRDAGEPLPRCAAVISPWTDLANTGGSLVTNASTEVMLDPTGIDGTALLYADEDQRRDPHVSPLYGDPTGLPPLLIHASGAEILLDDSLRFAASAAGAGVDVTIDVVDGMPHVWHLFAGFLPEADTAMDQIGSWLAAQLAAPRSEPTIR